MLFVLNFGGDRWGMKGRSIGRVGPLFLNQKMKVGWDLEI